MYLMAVAVGLALAVSVATLVPIGSRKREGMLLWALGLVLYALTYLLYGLRGQVSDFFSIVVGNTALSAGLAMLTHALLVFQQRQWPPWRIWVPVATAVAVHRPFSRSQPPRRLDFQVRCLKERGLRPRFSWEISDDIQACATRFDQPLANLSF